MNKRVMFGVLAAALVAVPAAVSAAPSAKAQWDALSTTGGISPQVLNEIQQKMVVPADAPVRWQVISVNDDSSWMEQQAWEREGAIVAEIRTGISESFIHILVPEITVARHVFDSLGLIELKTTNTSDGRDYQRAGAFSISEKIDPSQPTIAASISFERMRNGFGDNLDGVIALRLSLVGTPASLQVAFPDGSGDKISPQLFEARSDKHDINKGLADFTFDPRFDVFMPSGETVLDWQIADQPWHSQQVSAALSLAQKAQANSLFARGFDLYKAGDFTGAKALIDTGQKIDPGNYLGWFTLAEVSRAAATNLAARNDDPEFERDNARIAYQHTIDLAPGSPEAALAKGYLAALH
jgi:hypothetical protein